MGAAMIAWSPSAHASAQVNKFSLMLSANPTSLKPKEFNEKLIGGVNNRLQARGLEPMDEITFGWLYEAELRYFLRPNFALGFGVGQVRSVSKQEYLPRINAAIQFRAELLSVPVHLGGTYYLPPYNQGDFQARWYFGGGMTSLVYDRARFQAVETGTDSTSTLGGTYKISAHGDSPGYYMESGVHMFFASRFSVMLGLMYRSALIRQMEGTLEVPSASGTTHVDLGPVLNLDTSGTGARFAVAIGF